MVDKAANRRTKNGPPVRPLPGGDFDAADFEALYKAQTDFFAEAQPIRRLTRLRAAPKSGHPRRLPADFGSGQAFWRRPVSDRGRLWFKKSGKQAADIVYRRN